MSQSSGPTAIQSIPDVRPVSDRNWTNLAIERLKSDFNRSADTHLIKLSFAATPGINLYLKDESTHPTGSLKHRLSRSLFLYGICNGWITEGKHIIEASSGCTAISDAYFARLLELPFTAVIPASTAKEKIHQIEYFGGRCELVAPEDIYQRAHELAASSNGHYMDQFTYAERATDWRGNNNIAESIFRQMESEPHPDPAWVVVGAGTGGSAATIGRYIRYNRSKTRLCVVDPENSVFFECYRSGDRNIHSQTSSRIEGIGRPRVEPSFLPQVIDRMMRIPDAASIAAIHWLEEIIHKKVGGSTGTALYAAVNLISEMKQHNQTGSIVTMIGDGGDRYLDTYYNQDWLKQQQIDINPFTTELNQFMKNGKLKSLAGIVSEEH